MDCFLSDEMIVDDKTKVKQQKAKKSMLLILLSGPEDFLVKLNSFHNTLIVHIFYFVYERLRLNTSL